MGKIYLLYIEGEIFPFCADHGTLDHNHLDDEYCCPVCKRVTSGETIRRLKLELWEKITQEIMEALKFTSREFALALGSQAIRR